MTVEAITLWFLTYKYFVFFPIALFEGAFLPIIGGFLLQQGYVHIVPLFIALFIGNLIGDSMWYAIGYRWADTFTRRFGKFFGVSQEMLTRVEGLFHRHAHYILIISKITMGFGFALVALIGAGAVKIPFRKYVLLNSIGGILWISGALAVGYFFGHLTMYIDKGFRMISLVAFLITILFVLARVYKYTRKKILARL